MGWLIEDYRNNSKKSFLVLFLYRTCNNIYLNGHTKTAAFVNILYSIFRWFFRIEAQISYKCTIGHGIRFPHEAQGVVISRYAEIGDEVVIYQGVTIGINERMHEKKVSVGNNCFIGAGAKIINACVGDNCSIGANAVVYKDISNGLTIVALSKCIEK